ncbi:hypothetical protein TWF506_006060 [Arthrobotrys conoides]|uniref:Uncharacterized protein n=1 Tax=Arthrobotrys conoides TaxID=74498 RepID=A0AAN8PJY8_9PEZI
MSQSVPSSPIPSLKARSSASRPQPPRPPKRQASVISDASASSSLSSLLSLSDSELPRKEDKETSIAACVPEDFNCIWDIVADGLRWDPAETTMPQSVQSQLFDLIQANRKFQDQIGIDSWVRGLLEEHFADINEHCDEIASGRITKPMGNSFILSLTEPYTLGFRRFWVDCVIGNQEKHKLARRSVNQFVNIVVPRPQTSKGATISTFNTPITGLPVYRKVSEKISGKLDELVRLGRYMAGMVKDIETTTLQFGMRYKPLTRQEHDIVDEVIWWAETIVNFYTLDFDSRQKAKNFVGMAKSLFSGDRLPTLEVRFKEWGISEEDQGIVAGNLPSPSLFGTGPTEGHQKALLIRHIYLIERHVSAIWRELFLAIELCLDVQLACYQWYHVMQDRYHETVRKIKDTRSKPDMRLYIGLKERRAGKRMHKWE